MTISHISVNHKSGAVTISMEAPCGLRSVKHSSIDQGNVRLNRMASLNMTGGNLLKLGVRDY